MCYRNIWKYLSRNIKKILSIKVYLLKKVENFVVKEETADFDQLLLLPHFNASTNENTADQDNIN